MPRVKKNQTSTKVPVAANQQGDTWTGCSRHRACPAADRQNHGGGGDAGQESRERTPGLSCSGQAEPRRRGEMQARKAGRGQRVGVSCLGSGGAHTPFLQL